MSNTPNLEPPWVIYEDAVGVPIPDSTGCYYVVMSFKPDERKYVERAVHAMNCHAALVGAVQSILDDSEARLKVCDVLKLREAMDLANQQQPSSS